MVHLQRNSSFSSPSSAWFIFFCLPTQPLFFIPPHCGNSQAGIFVEIQQRRGLWKLTRIWTSERSTLLFHFRRFNRTHSYTTSTADTFLRINLRIIKPFFIGEHCNSSFWAYRVACAATATVLLAFVENWYWFIFHLYYTSLCQVAQATHYILLTIS